MTVILKTIHTYTLRRGTVMLHSTSLIEINLEEKSRNLDREPRQVWLHMYMYGCTYICKNVNTVHVFIDLSSTVLRR